MYLLFVRKKSDSSLSTQYEEFKLATRSKLDAKMFNFVRENFSPVEQLTRLSNNAVAYIQIQNSSRTKVTKANINAVPDPAFVFAM